MSRSLPRAWSLSSYATRNPFLVAAAKCWLRLDQFVTLLLGLRLELRELPVRQAGLGQPRQQVAGDALGDPADAGHRHETRQEAKHGKNPPPLAARAEEQNRSRT